MRSLRIINMFCQETSLHVYYLLQFYVGKINSDVVE